MNASFHNIVSIVIGNSDELPKKYASGTPCFVRRLVITDETGAHHITLFADRVSALTIEGAI